MGDDLDDTDRWLFAKVFGPMRVYAVRALLAGNDAQCFTTEQYRAEFRRQNPLRNWDPAWPDPLTLEACRRHLGLMQSMVREVRPDIWAATE